MNGTIKIKTIPPLKEYIRLFILLNNGPTCAKCTITFQVLSLGLRNDYSTTVDPGDGSGSWVIEMQDRGTNIPDWVAEHLIQRRVLIPEGFHSGNLDHTYNRPGQFRAVATIKEPFRHESDFISTISIVIIDLLPELPPIIGTVALFNNGPVYQHQNVDLVLIIEHLTQHAEVTVSDGIQILFSHLKPAAGQSIPAWVRDEIASYRMIGNRTDCPTLQLQHSFASSGAHILEAIISDRSYDDIVTAHTQVIVLQLPCSDRELHIRGGGGLMKEHALKLKQRDFLKLHIEIDLDCNITGIIIPAWKITHFDASTSDSQPGKLIQLPPEADVKVQELYLPPFSLDVGYYQFYFKMIIPTNTEQGYITAYNQTWILMTFAPHLNHMRFGILRNVLGLDSVTMIAISQLLEIENEHVHTSDQSVTCAWFCIPENSPGVNLDSLLTNNYSFPESGGCFGTGIKLPQDDPVFVFKADQLVYDKTSLPSKFKFHVIVTGLKHETLSATHELAIIADYDPQLRIMCISNCNRTFNTNQELVLEAACVKNCNDRETVKYEWKFSPASTRNFIQEIAWKTETGESLTSRLIVKANVFPKGAQGQSYSFIVIATKNNGLIGSELHSVNIPLEAKALESSAATYYLICFKGLMTFILTIILHHTLLDYITPMDWS